MSNRRDKSHPRLLPQVLKAVVELRDINGSTAKKIVSRVNELIKRSRTTGPKPRNVTMQVRKALHHGLENGLLKYRGGRYKLVFGEKRGNLRTMSTRQTAAAPSRKKKKSRTRKRTTRSTAAQKRKRKRSSTSTRTSSSEDDTTSEGDGDETRDSVSSVTVSGSSASSCDVRGSTSKSAESVTAEPKKSDKNKKSGRCKTNNKKNTVGMPSSLWCLIKERCGLATQRGLRTKQPINNNSNNKKNSKKPLRRHKNKKSKARSQQQTMENLHENGSNTNVTIAEVTEEKIAQCDNPNCLCNVDILTDDTVFDATKYPHDEQNISHIN